MSRVLFIAPGLVWACVLMAGGASPNSFATPQPQRLAFTSEVPARESVVVTTIASDGTGRRALTNPATPSYSPQWSPDGSKLAYIREDRSSRRLWIMRADGTGGRSIFVCPRKCPWWPTEDTWFSWAPDSRRLVIVKGSSLVVADVTGKARPLVSVRAGSPVWSPDGRWIAYLFSRPLANGGDDSELRLVHPDGTGDRLLLSGNAHEEGTDAIYRERYFFPQWSRDSTRVVLLAELEEWGRAYSGGTRIRLAKLDGSSTTCCAGSIGEFALDPSGSVMLTVVTGTDDFRERLVQVRLDSGTARTIARQADDVRFGGPSWSSSGRQIAFTRYYHFETWALTVSSPDGTGARTVARGSDHGYYSYVGRLAGHACWRPGSPRAGG